MSHVEFLFDISTRHQLAATLPHWVVLNLTPEMLAEAQSRGAKTTNDAPLHLQLAYGDLSFADCDEEILTAPRLHLTPLGLQFVGNFYRTPMKLTGPLVKFSEISKLLQGGQGTEALAWTPDGMLVASHSSWRALHGQFKADNLRLSAAREPTAST